jgi:hypothetical protein
MLINISRTQFTEIVDAAWTLWQKNFRRSECALVSVRKFLDDEKARLVLGSEKVLPMQVRLQVKDGCKALTACKDYLRDAPVLLFMLDTPFESTLVAGAAENVEEVAVSENTVEESQRCALRRMQIFMAASQHTSLKSKVRLAAAKAAALRINLNVEDCGIVATTLHAPSRAPLLLPLLLSHNLPLPRVH